MKTQSSEHERKHHEYFRNLRRFAQWLAKWRHAKRHDTAGLQVLMGEAVAKTNGWRSEK